MSNAVRVEDLFLAALEQGTAADRAAYLDSTCGGDAELRRQVEKMLKAHPRVGDFLKKPAAEQLAAASEHSNATHEIGTSTEGKSATPPDRNEPCGARTEGEGLGDEQDGALDFLQSSTRPNSLGRLGHYEVLQVLGRGGFGIVFRVFDEVLQRVVAVKVLVPHLAATSPARKRFLREAQSFARARHENVVQVYAVEEQPLPYLVMEFIPGETLQQRLDRTGPFEASEVASIGRQIAQGLAAAHATGLIHRDIKPSNILIESSPQQRVKITDFGLARAADDASLTQSGVVAGTPMFMAPEQASGETLDHRADLFSLGSVLYTMCSGRPPFRAGNTLAVLKRVAEDTPRPIPEIIPEVPQWLCDLITRLHAKKPEDRFATASEVADLLGQYLAQMQSPGHVPAPPVVAEKKPQPGAIAGAAPTRKPHFRLSSFWVAATVLLLLLGGFGYTEANGVTNLRSTVIRLFSPEGTLVVEVDDPTVSIQIDGSDLVIKGAGAREIRLKPGMYTVEAHKKGKVVRRELVSVTKNGRQVVRVSQEPSPDPDRRAAEYVLSLGGVVQVDEQERDLTNVTALPQVPFRLTGINLEQNKEVSDAGLGIFKDCKNLIYLRLNHTLVTDVGLAHFKDCRSLTILGLHHTQVSDAGLASFKDCKNLQKLLLAGTQVTDAGLATLKGCDNLTYLNLAHTEQVNGTGLAHLKDCKNLTHLCLNETQVSNAGLAHLKDCKNLMFLSLHFTQQVSDTDLAHLKHCKNLTELHLGLTKVTAAGIDDLKKALPNCQIKWDGGVIDPKAAKP